MKKGKKIVQLVAPQCPVFAAYNEKDERPKSKEDIFLTPCPVVALIEENGDQEVVGLVVDTFGLRDPSNDSNFLGFAESQEDALKQYLVVKGEAS